MPLARTLSRRRAVALAGATALPLVHMRTAGAAGKLSIAFVDHFVPGSVEAMRKLVERWGEQNRVEVQADFITLIGNKIWLTVAAESQARTGHDIITLLAWDPHQYAERLAPVDQVVSRLSAKYGELSPLTAYAANVEGSYRAVPSSFTTVYFPTESRIDLFRQYLGMDVQATFPVAATMGPGYDAWSWDNFLPAAETCFKAGYPFGLPLGQTSDSVDWVGALFRCFGAELVNAKGEITVRSDAVRAVLDYARRLAPFLPPDVYVWDNASNNRALIAGKSALIFNPPSAWAVALRDAPKVGEQIWHHPMPAGPKSRVLPLFATFLGVWEFSPNKRAAMDLIEWLSQREQVEALSIASRGFDIPPFQSMLDFPIWQTEGPPAGTLFNYPIKPGHHAEANIAGWPAPPQIAAQIHGQAVMPKMIARVTQSGLSIEQSLATAEQELESFMR
jgi:ABC-type glycerol-3-phosphate transport system substrate-binding protein